ncbi:GNAT family N-acetyltransferase [Thermoproteus sp. CP80]|jgi:ribosomal protein S18 acetylase RimI-like enzyme|uniref:GNAT family N-acetyltransferase n=1 Tax=Thermoproteus sp. CP80 TaxID=1650659 RepID=UPI0007491600|nr:GNAT family N-acetyltransferase [Thermoproteus sp. CP80]KUO85661.1 MAG: acyltransferase [Thermoproteus sp. CIS_19]KUO86870.1 MAG: acyltransferase [Thermoproteus sp. JCHS_4]PLC64880.1 GNAT family N-acetyltransferase [Thermoproteus sp. CP80]
MYPNIVIRAALESDVDALADLIARLKRLNGEFDPLLKPAENLLAASKEYVKSKISSPSSVVLVAEVDGRAVGVIVGDVEDRLFYEPRMAGIIREFYVLPEFRRKGLGKRMMSEAMDALRRKGAQMIMADFPALNEIAIEFYKKMNFRPIESIYAKEV